jgi:type II secretory pathway predicted ATPase ExeA
MVLVGQPQLRDKINSQNLEQLRQRISVRFHITPLERDEIADYINHRLKIAGSDGSVVFLPDAVALICDHSKGIPRLINRICDKALLCAYAAGTKTIDIAAVMRSVDEVEGAATVGGSIR